MRSTVLRWFLRLVLVVALVIVGRPFVHLGAFALRDEQVSQIFEADFADDVSGLERTRVAETWPVPKTPEDALRGLQNLLVRARRDGLAVSIAGARHSMGGHTIAPGGIVVDMRGFNAMTFDAEQDLLTVGAGAKWSEVLRTLDGHGRSVAVMQSNDSFTVGGSVSVNCHGWQHGRPPIASTVRSLQVLTAAGRVVRCSRTLEPELFSCALGGYGLFGIILEVELEVTANELYSKSSEIIPADELGRRFLERAADPEVGLAIGRLSVDPDGFLEDAIFKVLKRVETKEMLPGITPSGKRGLRRAIFRGSAGSAYGKSLRWTLERRLGSLLLGGQTTRNSELAEPVDWFSNHDPSGTDVLLEMFVPHAALNDFLGAARPVVKGSRCDLLNVTVRDIRRDEDTLLRYASGDVFSLVMFFHQEKTEAAELRMRDMTRALIDCADAVGGSYYLPYRLHATRQQFERAYPSAGDFFEAKRRWDPDELFQNQFYRAYGARKH